MKNIVRGLQKLEILQKSFDVNDREREIGGGRGGKLYERLRDCHEGITKMALGKVQSQGYTLSDVLSTTATLSLSYVKRHYFLSRFHILTQPYFLPFSMW